MKSVIEFDTAIGTSNLGDEIILACLRKEMAFLFDDCFVMRLGTHVKNFELTRYLFNSKKLDFAENADYKLIMGTNILTRNVRKTSAQWPIGNLDSWLYVNSILAGVGTTLGEGKITAKTKRIYKRILRKDFYHSVRDEASKRFLESLGFKAINTGCPTLWAFTPQLCASIPVKKADKVVFSLSGYKAQADQKYDKMLLDILRSNYSELYFWCQTTEDETYLDTFSGTESIPRIYSLEKYEQLLNNGDVDYVGTRLHGGIYALQHGVRSIVISIDHRAQGFHDTNNLNICVREDIPGKLNQMINSDLVTDIRVDREAIEKWKSQFCIPHDRTPVKTHKSLWYIKITQTLYGSLRDTYRKSVMLTGKIKGDAKKAVRHLKKEYTAEKYKSLVNNTPIQKGNTIFFTFQGEYTCNPKYISEELTLRKPEWKQTWVALTPEQKQKSKYPAGSDVVVFGTDEYYKALGSAEFLVDNAFNFVKGYTPKKKGQFYIETMHGSLGIKKIGPDVVKNAERNRRGQKCGALTDFCLSNSTFETMVYETSFWKKESIIETGHARNDLFFVDEEEQKKIREKVYNYFELNGSEKLALYAPTFRNKDEQIKFSPIDFSLVHDALIQRFGGEWIMLNREHHSSSENRVITEDYVKDANNYPDIQELMIAIDVGITDYSSWIYDYVLTHKPGFLYTPDLNNYDHNRGFYYPIQEAPFQLAVTNNELGEKILSFDDSSFAENVQRFLSARGCMDDGHASERIVNLMINTSEGAEHLY